jgi:DNA/RNA-binding domain of Phe-tRNA-synthetase-like protein
MTALQQAAIDPEVLTRHSDYQVLLMTAENLAGGPSDHASNAALEAAETHARSLLSTTALDQIPQIARWRDAYRSFGVKPRQARSSVESLLRRASDGLPRIDRLTDIYNAVSVLHLMPVGGEDLDAYVGPPRLIVATGDEPFDTVANGEPVNDPPAPEEIVWRDDLGVTCRRWNWRQGTRTRLTPSTTNALFIFDGLAPSSEMQLREAAEDLAGRLGEATFTSRLLALDMDGP